MICRDETLNAVSRWVLSYQPQHCDASTWASVKVAVVNGVLVASPTLAVAKKTAPHAVAFAVWAYTEGAPAFEAAITDPDWIERYIAVGMPGAAESTAGDSTLSIAPYQPAHRADRMRRRQPRSTTGR